MRISRKQFRVTAMWGGLLLIVLLILLSVYGAFLGADRAKVLFNSLPLTVFWFTLLVLLIAALLAFRRLVRIPSLLLMHFGCVLILAGSIWGSDAGHNVQQRVLGTDKIPKGIMIIYEGYSDNRVFGEDNEEIAKLPFSIGLKDFRTEYYEPGHILIQTGEGQSWKIPVEIGREFPLDNGLGAITTVRIFKNFRWIIDEGTAIDSPQPGSNPALEVRLKDPNGVVTTKYVFERFPGHAHRGERFLLRYHRMISDYISDLQVVKGGEIVAEKSIEVNHPLHFAGYHFYQHKYDAQAGRYTILMVVSDTGLYLVYAGYAMLCVGVFWHFWLSSVIARIRSKTGIDGN
ncbi:MAG: cytochrome c biogenesis protein ResB [Planctomycetota bacterium]